MVADGGPTISGKPCGIDSSVRGLHGAFLAWLVSMPEVGGGLVLHMAMAGVYCRWVWTGQTSPLNPCRQGHLMCQLWEHPACSHPPSAPLLPPAAPCAAPYHSCLWHHLGNCAAWWQVMVEGWPGCGPSSQCVGLPCPLAGLALWGIQRLMPPPSCSRWPLVLHGGCACPRQGRGTIGLSAIHAIHEPPWSGALLCDQARG